MNEIYIDNYVITSSIEDILKVIQQELTNGKLSRFTKTSSGIKVQCPSHAEGKEQHESCYINEDGVWHCFTCGAKGNIISFVASCFDIEYDDAKQWLINHFCDTLVDRTIDIGDFTLHQENEVKYLDETKLNEYQSWHPYMAKRKLSQKVCEKFKIKYDPKSECIVFPV